jgi:hypothetical protein
LTAKFAKKIAKSGKKQPEIRTLPSRHRASLRWL